MGEFGACALDAQALGGQIRAMALSDQDELIDGGDFGGPEPHRAFHFEVIRVVRREVEQLSESLLRPLIALVFVLRGHGGDFLLDDQSVEVVLLLLGRRTPQGMRREQLVDQPQAALRRLHGVAGGHGVDECRVEVVDRQPGGVPVLEFQEVLLHPGQGDSHPPLARVIERVDDADAMVDLAGLAPRIGAVGDAVGRVEQQGVVPQARGEDVRFGLGDLEELGAEVAIGVEQPLDGLVEAEAVGWPLAIGLVRDVAERGRHARAGQAEPLDGGGQALRGILAILSRRAVGRGTARAAGQSGERSEPTVRIRAELDVRGAGTPPIRAGQRPRLVPQGRFPVARGVLLALRRDDDVVGQGDLRRCRPWTKSEHGRDGSGQQASRSLHQQNLRFE